MSTTVARYVSILGHPLMLVSVALMATQARGGASPAWQAATAVALVLFALLLMAYSRRQVRRGEWAHVDASGMAERRRLNRVLLVALVAAAVVAWAADAHGDVICLLALSAAIVAIAAATARWCTLSLHLAFAVFVALVFVPLSAWSASLLLLLAVAITWSRLALSRHAACDLAAAALAGGCAGGVFVLGTSG